MPWAAVGATQGALRARAMPSLLHSLAVPSVRLCFSSCSRSLSSWCLRVASLSLLLLGSSSVSLMLPRTRDEVTAAEAGAEPEAGPAELLISNCYCVACGVSKTYSLFSALIASNIAEFGLQCFKARIGMLRRRIGLLSRRRIRRRLVQVLGNPKIDPRTRFSL